MTPEPGVYCIEPGCHRPATGERPIGVTRDGELIVELVCDRHSPRHHAASHQIVIEGMEPDEWGHKWRVHCTRCGTSDRASDLEEANWLLRVFGDYSCQRRPWWARLMGGRK